MADISINAVSRRVQYTGNTGTGPYAFTFNILADADLAVYKGTTLLTLTTDYTVSTNADGTGSITLTVALVSSDVLTILGARLLERTTDFVAGGDFFAASINEQMDSQVIMAQQLDEKLSRAIKVNPGDEFTDLELPLKANRKGTVLGFNATTGDPEAGPTIADVSSLADITADIATLADIEDGTDATDAIQTVAGISSNVTTVAGISGNVSTVAGISSDVTSVAGDATDIGTVATDITNVNTVAGSIASVNTAAANITDIQNASTNAATATTKAAEAATSASNAAASATSAANAQIAAETARDQTLAAYDNFDDRYLGTKSSDPTVDNDGNALVAGALYFNSTDEIMKVYTGSAWVAAYASLSGALLVANNLSDLASAASARTNLGLGTAATTASTDYAAASHTHTLSEITDAGTAAAAATTDFATSAQGTLADSAVQPNDSPSFGSVSVTGTITATAFSGDGSSLTGIDVGATGGGSDKIFWENDQTVTTNYTITNGKNAMSAGPITINSGITVTVGAGETWTVV